jgi:chitodextrinase
MEQLQTSLLLIAALSVAAASAHAQGATSSPAAGASASPSNPATIASAIDREISHVEKEVVEAAEAMPESKFDFSPEKLNISGSAETVKPRRFVLRGHAPLGAARNGLLKPDNG